MFKAGKIVRTKSGAKVHILHVLSTPTRDGDAIIGLYSSHGDTEVVTWSANGVFNPAAPGSLDLVAPPQIETQFVFPPIPDRRFDYCAKWADADDETQQRGWGATEADAIADLKANYPREEEGEAA